MKLDYIVPTKNSEKTLELCLKSIVKFGNPNNIIIVDEFSSDDTVKIAKKYKCKVYQTVGGLGHARIFGANKATSDRIVYVDSDVELTKDWFKVLDYTFPIVSGYIDNYNKIRKLPVIGVGKFFIACCIINGDIILRCPEMDSWVWGEDSRFSRQTSEFGIILDVECIHHNKDNSKRWRSYGSVLRDIDGFSLIELKKIIGGAIFGIPMTGIATKYLDNMLVRYHFLIGYLKL